MRLIAEDGQREWLKLADYAARLTRDDWQEVVWSGEAGGRRSMPILSRVGFASLVLRWCLSPVMTWMRLAHPCATGGAPNLNSPTRNSWIRLLSAGNLL
jgi:hypothetical protein